MASVAERSSHHCSSHSDSAEEVKKRGIRVANDLEQQYIGKVLEHVSSGDLCAVREKHHGKSPQAA